MTGAARPRPRVALAVPLPRGATSEADLVEMHLCERLPVDEVRRRVLAGLPVGITLQAIEDEWIGAPSLASRVAVVVYRVDVDAGGPRPAPEEVVPPEGAGSPESFRPAEGPSSRAGRDSPEGAGSPEGPSATLRVVEWDEETGRGSLALRFVRDTAGRLGRPSETVESLGLGLRVVRLVRVSVELQGE